MLVDMKALATLAVWISAGIPSAGLAQQYLGELAAACGQVQPGAPLDIALTSPVEIDDLVAIAVAGRADFVGELRVRDSEGNVYHARGGARSTGDGLVTAIFSGIARAKLTPGAALTLEAGTGPAALPVCLSASRFSEVAGGADAQDAATDGIQSGNALALQSSTRRGSDTLTLASFGLAGNPGALNPGTAVVVPPVCNQDQTLCLVRAHVTDATAGARSISISSTNSQPWTGSLAVFYARENLLRDGFEAPN